MSASPPARRIVAFVPDLMDRSRITTAARSGEVIVVFVADLGSLAARVQEGDLVVVDVSRPAALAALPAVVAAGAPVVAFGAHVEREVLSAARAAGCRAVLARSAFFGRLPALLAGDSTDTDATDDDDTDSSDDTDSTDDDTDSSTGA